ncbi:MAG TPA: PilN domain-containing protein [Alphaproteobacteria bacterium]|nr:PilN domain-containing protein [Alphaproteobacteria bacterium]
MRFNYLRDSAPDALEYLRPSRVSEPLRTPLAALATVVCVVGVWWVIEQILLGQARSELQVQALRLSASRIALKDLNLRKSRIEELITIDERLRKIRRSGAELSHGLADIANHVPAQAWLTSIEHIDTGLQIDGSAEGFDGLSETVADLMSSSSASAPSLVRASKETQDLPGNIIAFEVRLSTPR